jgi:hypothetical protein
METYRFLMPGRLIPSLKKAAKDASVDVLSINAEDDAVGHYTVELMAYNAFALVNMGMIMGMDQALRIFNEPSDDINNK